jgi:propionyl-CoA carboxylase alpha chain
VHHPVRIEAFDPASGQADVEVGGRHYRIQSHSKLGDILMTGSCNGQPFTAQVERGSARNPLGIRVAHNGTQIETLVLLPRAAELFRLMPHKAPPDTSKFLLSPMPGLLADIVVQPGQKVLAGERLAVIEAMKMENILTAAQDGTVAELLARKGESLAVDQPILSFA